MSAMLIVGLVAALAVTVVIVAALAEVVRERRAHRVSAREQRLLIRREQYRAEQRLRALTHAALAEMLHVAREESDQPPARWGDRHG